MGRLCQGSERPEAETGPADASDGCRSLCPSAVGKAFSASASAGTSFVVP